MIRHRVVLQGIVIFCLLIASSISIESQTSLPYPIVGTGQTDCYNLQHEIACPAAGQPFHGQDGSYESNEPRYTLSEDGLTVHDPITRLTWQQSPDTNQDGSIDASDKLSWHSALEYPATLNAAEYGGFADWRLPSIKELYSLILFTGTDPSGYQGSDTSDLTPFLDDHFAFGYGDTEAGERIIDAQYWSSTEYVTTTMNGDHTVFGVNFADGRIKGYGTHIMGRDKTSFVLCVRGNPEYGINQFTNNVDGTITDDATGLMWTEADSGEPFNWKDALAYAEELEFAGYDDWRLPHVKELQSILDYTRSPATDGTAAIDPIFKSTEIINEAGASDSPYYWSSTTHLKHNGMADAAAYVAFGRAMGYMHGSWIDVHGAGSQRSDPKMGDPGNYPTGHGPQGDAIRIYNYVRCVRTADTDSSLLDWQLH